MDYSNSEIFDQCGTALHLGIFSQFTCWHSVNDNSLHNYYDVRHIYTILYMEKNGIK